MKSIMANIDGAENDLKCKHRSMAVTNLLIIKLIVQIVNGR